MSANNWAICPKCNRQRVETIKRLDCSIVEAYGKLPQDKYLELVAARDNPPRLQNTLREDYEIGMYDAERFVVSYRAHCGACGFAFSFKHEELVDSDRKGEA